MLLLRDTPREHKPSPMEAELSGSTVVVTGAAGRLGRAVCDRLGLLGAKVIGIDAAEAQAAAIASFVRADLTLEHEAEDAFAEVNREAERIDAVIHAVGAWGGAPLADTSKEDFEELLRTNLTSTFLCFREAVRMWRSRGRSGHLVALASMQGADRGVAQQAAYSAAKAGVVRLVEAAAAEYREHGITAAAVAPSMILFGREPQGTAGVPVDRVVSLCIYLATAGATAHNGAVIRAYGSMM